MQQLRLDDTYTIFKGCYLDVSAIFTFDAEGRSHLAEPAQLSVRYAIDRRDPLTGFAPIPESADLHGVTPDLQPCRYCGERTDLVWDSQVLHQGRWRETVMCGGCGVIGPIADKESEAVRRWNEGVPNRY